jgi:hypothetical protein
MSDLHPHWRSIEKQGQKTPEQNTTVSFEKQTESSSEKRVTRVPAAIVGILVMVGTAYMALQNQSLLVGDTVSTTLPSDTHIIKISDSEITPRVITAKPGELITIVNDTKTPQIIQSDTLHIDEGNILVSPAIQPGSAYSFNIFSTEEEKTYRFILFTNPSLFGDIIVRANSLSSASSEYSSAQSEIPTSGSATSETTVIVQNVNASSSSSESSSSAEVFIPASANLIPQNPYTVANQKNGNSIQASTTNPPLHSGPRPAAQPNSGPDELLYCAIAALCVLLLCQKKLLGYQIIKK